MLPRGGAVRAPAGAEGLANLGEGRWSNLSLPSADSMHGHRTDVLALRSRIRLQPIGSVRREEYFGAAATECSREGDNLDDVRPSRLNSTSGHHHGRTAQPGLASFGQPKIEFDDVTRRQHRATPPRPGGALR